MARENGIVLFDGVCNLCTWSVQFIAPRDAKAYFQFASLQSPIGQELLEKYRVDRRGVDSVVLIEGGKGYVKSDAALRILHHLDGWWSLAWGLRVVPRFLRDWIYDRIAAHRYSIFGQREACLLYLPNAQERFLDADTPPIPQVSTT